MKYLGSKNRIAKYILPIILKDRGDKCYVEPFVGGANIIDKVIGYRIGSDNNEYVISLLKKMQENNFKAPKISENLYLKIKHNKNDYEKWIVGYAGTQLSFGSTWFGSYRKDNTGIRDYCKEARNNVEKQSKNILGIEFYSCNYYDLKIPDNSIIYCDKPYDTIATKGKYKEKFNHEEFWDWCRKIGKQGHQIFVSEYNAPDDFICVWQKEIKQKMNNNVKTTISSEKLFRYNIENEIRKGGIIYE